MDGEEEKDQRRDRAAFENGFQIRIRSGIPAIHRAEDAHPIRGRSKIERGSEESDLRNFYGG